MPMCSIVRTLHLLKIGYIQNKKSNVYEFLTINTTDIALYEMKMKGFMKCKFFMLILYLKVVQEFFGQTSYHYNQPMSK